MSFFVSTICSHNVVLLLFVNTDMASFQDNKGNSCAKQCAACGQSSVTIKRCGRCRNALYCNTKCQEMHWVKHKISCVTDEFYDLLQNKRNGLLEFLNRSDNGDHSY